MFESIIYSLFKEKYNILQKIGSGGCSQVYKVECVETKKVYALKLITHPSMEQEVEHEKNILATLGRLHDFKACTHQNYSVEGASSTEQTYFGLVMEFVPGVVLVDYLKNNPKLPIINRVNLIVKIVEELYKIHKNKIIHNDVSPSNFIYDPKTDIVTLIDFGWSKQINKNDKFSLGYTGHYWGWRWYGALENLHCEGVPGGTLTLKPSTDVYAMGESIRYILGNSNLKRFPYCKTQPSPVYIGIIGKRIVDAMVHEYCYNRPDLLSVRKDFKVLKFLVDNQFSLDDLTVENDDKFTPLMLATEQGDEVLCRSIIKISAGARTNKIKSYKL